MRVIDLDNFKLVSVNRKYTIARNARKLILSGEYRTFKEQIGFFCKRDIQFESKPLSMRIHHSSNLDVDNPVKCIIDGLQEAGVIQNDKLIEDLHVTLDRKKTGRLTVDIDYHRPSDTDDIS